MSNVNDWMSNSPCTSVHICALVKWDESKTIEMATTSLSVSAWSSEITLLSCNRFDQLQACIILQIVIHCFSPPGSRSQTPQRRLSCVSSSTISTLMPLISTQALTVLGFSLFATPLSSTSVSIVPLTQFWSPPSFSHVQHSSPYMYVYDFIYIVILFQPHNPGCLIVQSSMQRTSPIASSTSIISKSQPSSQWP